MSYGWAKDAEALARGVEPAKLYIHLEDADGEPVFWAESPEVPGLTMAAASHLEVLRLSALALEAMLGRPVQISARVADGTETVTPSPEPPDTAP